MKVAGTVYFKQKIMIYYGMYGQCYNVTSQYLEGVLIFKKLYFIPTQRHCFDKEPQMVL